MSRGLRALPQKQPKLQPDSWLVGIDPSLNASGICWITQGGEVYSRQLPIEEAGVLLDGFVGHMTNIFAVIEKPNAGRGRRSDRTFSMDPVRSAKAAWIRAIKKRWPRKNVIVEPTVNEWRAIVGVHDKQAALERTGLPTDDEAEAGCLLEYGLIINDRRRPQWKP